MFGGGVFLFLQGEKWEGPAACTLCCNPKGDDVMINKVNDRYLAYLSSTPPTKRLRGSPPPSPGGRGALGHEKGPWVSSKRVLDRATFPPIGLSKNDALRPPTSPIFRGHRSGTRPSFSRPPAASFMGSSLLSWSSNSRSSDSFAWGPPRVRAGFGRGAGEGGG